MFSKQQFFCNCCGKEMIATCNGPLGGGRTVNWRVCSIPCLREIKWRETLSIMNKEYYPHPDPNYHDPNYNPDTKKKF